MKTHGKVDKETKTHRQQYFHLKPFPDIHCRNVFELEF